MMERLMKRIKMERLTKRINGVVTYIGKENSYDTGQIAAELNAAARREILERLADYEDTERRPEEVQALNRLFYYALTESRTLQEQLALIERLRELAEADKDGRLAVLPCKIGGTVYLLLQDAVKYNPETCGWYISEDRVGAIAEGGFYLGDPADDIYVRNEEIGKEVFLTREEAEKALGKKG